MQTPRNTKVTAPREVRKRLAVLQEIARLSPQATQAIASVVNHARISQLLDDKNAYLAAAIEQIYTAKLAAEHAIRVLKALRKAKVKLLKLNKK